MKLFLTVYAIFTSLTMSAQTLYYKMPNGKIIDAQTYKNVKENLSKNGKVEELIISKITRNDSLIITPKLNLLTQKDENGNYVDPYGEQKKLIGTHFPIEIFKNERGRRYTKNKYLGKPTLINFWFTGCIPCIEEIPLLNALNAKTANKVNFAAITFDHKKTVDQFIKNHHFTFDQITDSKAEMEKLKIFSFPTTLILNKKGIIVDVYGEITNSETEILSTLNGLL